MSEVTTRQLAARLLLEIEEHGKYAAAAIADGLNNSSLQAKDRGLVTELVYGSLRVQSFLRREIGQFSKRPPSHPQLIAHLVIASYQIFFLERVPSFAAVNEAVTALKQEGLVREAGFANAVLRKIVEKVEASEVETATWEAAVLASSPSWLRKRLQRELGESSALSILVGARRPRPTLRFFSPPYPQWLQENAEHFQGLPGAFRYMAGGDPGRHEEHAAGQFMMQELGAQIIAAYAQPGPGELVLDVCAGRGNKTLLFAEALRPLEGEPQGEIYASDLYDEKLKQLQAQASARDLKLTTIQHDWTQAIGEGHVLSDKNFDRIIVDAPCTGLGTLARRPEIMRRVGASDPQRLAGLQLQILKNSALHLKQGGVLFFITCSVLKSEGEEIVQAFMSWAIEQGGEFVEEMNPAPHLRGSAWGAEAVQASRDFPLVLDNIVELGPRPASFRLLPDSDATDGYFISRLRLRKKIAHLC